MAVSMSLVLSRNTLTNVDDAAGRWQHEGGIARRGSTDVAHYATVRRVTTGGTDAQNTAMLTTTLFFIGKKPPENITLQGAHDFNSGNQVGSVSAASGAYSQYRGGTFTYNGSTSTLKVSTP
ncbi:MAG TPA: hypothetical protein VFV72_11650 [Candidatus Limnocylindrales bacterium]|nr:hypothetical protein [Candidatus Limnocylindrales bacterium]